MKDRVGGRGLVKDMHQIQNRQNERRSCFGDRTFHHSLTLIITVLARNTLLPSSNPLKGNRIPQESPPQNISINLETHNILPLFQISNHILELMPLSTHGS